MVEQSKMEEGEATFLVRHNLERCVEVWEGDRLCGYFLILAKDRVRSVHGYNLTRGRARHALKIALHLLKDETKIYSCHKEADQKVNRLLKLLGFKEKGKVGHEVLMQKVGYVSVQPAWRYWGATNGHLAYGFTDAWSSRKRQRTGPRGSA
jgi:hypothetical protein